MSWSVRIAILYLSFVALIVTLAVTCFGHKSELEFKDYYARELNFQDQIDAEKNALNLSEPIDYELDSHTVTIRFPAMLASNIHGEVHLIRPADSELDRKFSLNPDSKGLQTLPADSLFKGVYKMRISFTSGATPYFKEAVIQIR